MIMDKELMDCILSEDEIENVTENIALTYIGEKAYKAKEGDLDKEISTAIAKAQLQSPKLAAYIEERVSEAVHERNTIGNEIIRAMEELAEAQVKAERERHIERLNDMMGIGNICNERVFDYIKELEEVTK